MKLIICVAVAMTLTACGGGGGGSNSGSTSASAPVVVSTTPIANAGTPISVNVGEVVTLNGSASSSPSGGSLTYKWTMMSKPADSAVRFSDTNTAKPQMTNTMAGSYVASLIVNNGKADSTPATVSVTVNPIAVAPPRAPIQAEVQNLIDTAVGNIPQWLKSPSTFKLAEEPTWTYYGSINKPAEGAVTVKFDSQNGFGAMIRTTAICPANWDSRGYWRNTIQSSLALCIFM